MSQTPPIQNVMDRRVVRFLNFPPDQLLAVPVGQGAMGTSRTRIIETENRVIVQADQLPIKVIGIFLYSLIFVVAITVYLSGIGEKKELIAMFFAAIIIAPTMLALFVWINSMVGTQPYIVLDRLENTIELPRLDLKFSREHVVELVKVDRFLEEGYRFWQVALLVRQDDHWIYAHAFNQAGIDSPLWGKSFCREVADSLGIELKTLKYTKKESKQLPQNFRNVAD